MRLTPSGRRPTRRAADASPASPTAAGPRALRAAAAAAAPRPHLTRTCPIRAPVVGRADLVQSLESRLLLSVARDANGFTVVTPAANSRVIYVSATGGDAAAGTSPATATSLTHGLSLIRNGFPDQLLLRRGDVFNSSLTGWNKSGPSADQPMVIGAYTDPARPSAERPEFLTGIGNGFATAEGSANVPVSHLYIMGVAFEANQRNYRQPPSNFTTGFRTDAQGGTYGIKSLGQLTDFQVEDCSFQYFRTGVALTKFYGAFADVRLRRNVIADSYVPNYDPATGKYSLLTTDKTSEGVYAEFVTGLTIEGNVIDHNGWMIADDNGLGAVASIFNHDLYIQYNNTNVTVTGNIIADAASHGVQMRAGGTLTNNLFINDPIAMSFGLSTPTVAGGVYGTISGNVVVGGNSISGDPRGWGIEIANLKPKSPDGTGGTTLSNNIFTTYTGGTDPALLMNISQNTGNPTQEAGLRDLTIDHNVVYGWTRGLTISSSYVDGNAGQKGISGLVVTNNDFQRTAAIPIADHGNAYNPAYETWANNRYNSQSATTSQWFRAQGVSKSISGWQSAVEPTAQSVQVPYPDPGRTAYTYNQTLGGAPTDDAFLAQARLLSSQAWRPQYAAPAVIDYIRSGFAGQRVDVAPPTGTAAAPDVTVGGASVYRFTVTWTDDNQVTLSSLGDGDVRVTGPGGYDRLAALVPGSVVSNADGSTRTAAYTVPAPDGSGWSAADSGAYTLAAEPGQVTDPAGKAAAGVVGSFQVGIDLAGPVASLAPAPAVTNAAAGQTLTVTYTAPVAAAPEPVPLPDDGFEAPAVGDGNFQYSPAGAPWAFGLAPGGTFGGAGVSGNASTFTGGNPSAPDGGQVAFLQGNGAISQTVEGWAGGSYAIGFQAAQRAAYGSGPGGVGAEDFRVLVDGHVIGTFQPAGTDYAAYATAPFAVAAGTHTVQFVGLDSAGPGVDNTAFLDAVTIAPAGPPGPSAIAAASGDAGDLVVTGPGGYTATPALSAVSPAGGDASPLSATYTLPAPAGGWAAGTYAVSAVAGQVTATAGGAIAGGVIGSFAVTASPPTATAAAPDVTAKGGTTQTITVTYRDDTGVNAATLSDGDVRVYGPNGYNVAGTLTGVSGSGTTVTATYTVAAPAGGWQGSSNGAYTVVAQPGHVADADGNALPAGGIGAFQVNVDVYAPLAAAVATTVAAPSTAAKSITVNYVDPSGVTGLGAGDITVAGPNGFAATPTFVSSMTSGGTVTALYTLAPPGGNWQSSANGTYTVTLGSGQVADGLGNATAGGPIGTFAVALDTAPPAAAASAPAVTTPTTAGQTITVTYTDSNPGVKASTLDSSDILVRTPSGTTLPVTLQSVSPAGDGTPRTATYLLAAPAGGWRSSNNGTYSVLLQSGQVSDTAGNVSAGGTIGTFQVALETVPPTVAVAAVTPNPRNGSVSTMVVSFSEPVTGFDLSDLTLSKDGGPNLLTGGQTLATTNNTTFTLGNLAALTTANGTYTLTVNAAGSGVADPAGNLLAAGAATSFRIDTVAPTAAVAAVSPNPRAAPVDALAVTFTEPVTGFDLPDLILSRDAGPNLLTGAQTLSSSDGVTYVLGNLTGLTAQAGNYVLTVAGTGSGIADAAGNAFAAGASTAWTNTVTTPVVSTVTINDGTAQRSMVNSITVTFGAGVVVDPGAFVVVGRNGAGAGTVVSAASSADGRTYLLTFSGSPVVGGSLADGIYDLTVVGSKVHAGSASGPTMVADYKLAFHRLFSDVNGDGVSDNADLFQVRGTYLKPSTDPAYKWYFDYNQDGLVDNADVFQIRSRRNVVFQGY